LVGDEATYKAWVSATNAGGGINGHKVVVFYSDDVSNPATSVSEVETMITENHVVAIVDDSGVILLGSPSPISTVFPSWAEV